MPIIRQITETKISSSQAIKQLSTNKQRKQQQKADLWLGPFSCGPWIVIGQSGAEAANRQAPPDFPGGIQLLNQHLQKQKGEGRDRKYIAPPPGK